MTQYGFFIIMAVAPFFEFIEVLVSNYCEALSDKALYLQAIGSTANVDSFLSMISVTGFMPWHNTHSLSKGIAALNRMYNSLELNSPLKVFLDKHCLHLLKPLTGDTGIPLEYKNPNVLITLSDTMLLPPQFNPESFNILPNSVGTYVFFLKGESNVTQCGSSIRFVNRMHIHYHQAKKGEFIFDLHSIDNYYWVPVKYSNNYVQMFSIDNQMTSSDEYILTAFTQQEVRSLEQAYSTYAEPTNYKGQPINTWHNNWFLGKSDHNNTSKRVTWVTTDGNVHSRNTIDGAASALGCERKTIHYHAMQEGTMFYSAKYGKVTISIEGVSKDNLAMDKRYGTPFNTTINYDALEGNKYYLFDNDMNMLPHGPFSTAKEVSKTLDCAYGAINLWCNYFHLVKSTTLGLSVYIAKRTVDIKMPVILECLTDNTTTEYESMGRALNAMQKGQTNNAHLLSCIVNNKPYINKAGKSFLIKYKYQEHLNVAIERLEKARAVKKVHNAARKKDG